MSAHYSKPLPRLGKCDSDRSEKEMKSKLSTHLTVLGIICLLIVIVTKTWKSAQHAAHYGAIRALAVELTHSLESYKKAHNHFPPSLDNLSITNFPDGSTPEMIDEFEYRTDGNTFTLTQENLQTNR